MRKKVILVILTVVLIALGFWVKSRWHAWFAEPAELPYAVSQYPHRLLLTFGDSSPLSRNISWQCDTVLKDSHIELFSHSDSTVNVLPAVGEVFESRAGKAAYYHASIRDLKPGGQYSYRVSTGDESSEWHTFRVGIPEDNKFTFLYVGDVQDTVGGIAGKMLRESFARFPDTEFLVCAGDLVERPTDAEWGNTFSVLDSLATAVPIVNATGNHDYLKRVPFKLERRFPLVFSYFLDSAQGNNMVYSLKYGVTRFFVLDSNREFPYLWQQRNWLKSQLEKANEKWKILVIHHPVYSIRTNHTFVKALFEPLINDYGIDLVLQGHEHNYARKFTENADNTMTTPVYIISNLAPKNYSVKKPEDYNFIESGHRYIQRISINGDTLAYSCYRIPDFQLADSMLILNTSDLKQVFTMP